MNDLTLYQVLGISKKRGEYLDSLTNKIVSLCIREKLNISNSIQLIEEEIDINRQETIIIAFSIGVNYGKVLPK